MVLFQEYVIDPKFSKEQFVKSAVAYNSAASTNLLPVDAVFFGNSDRHVYVQLPRCDSNLEQLVVSGLSKKVMIRFSMSWGKQIFLVMQPENAICAVLQYIGPLKIFHTMLAQFQ